MRQGCEVIESFTHPPALRPLDGRLSFVMDRGSPIGSMTRLDTPHYTAFRPWQTPRVAILVWTFPEVMQRKAWSILVDLIRSFSRKHRLRGCSDRQYLE